MSFYNIYFSPTGGTKKIAEILAGGMMEPFVEVDMIKNPDALEQIRFTENDLCFISVPSFGGRLPVVVADKLKEIKGNGARIVLVAVFGNRSIDDTLIELQDILKDSGFCCLAGIEAVAEHSLIHQFGTGRPDQEDKAKLEEFSEKIKKCFGREAKAEELELPGNHNYREYHGVPLKPVTDRKCASCGLCAKECPTGAISKANPQFTDKEKCISCMHCIAICPKHARHCNRLMSFIAAQKMKKQCALRKENKLYL